jgi:PAS domain S-box-containing protein
MADITTTDQGNRQDLVMRILQLLNRRLDARELLGAILREIQVFSGMEAVAIRLRNGDEYPYFVYSGLSRSFVEAENTLCTRHHSGSALRDPGSAPALDCMCGSVIQGRTDSRLPFFTEYGSFWTNSTSDLLANTSETDRQARIGNRCHGEGYESVALIPLRSEAETLGLLQLNDSRRNCFTEQTIRFFEGIGASVGIVLARTATEDALRKALERQEAVVRKRTRQLEATRDRLLTELGEKKRAEEALRFSEEKYRTLIESTTDVVWTVDAQLKFTYVSQSITAVLGYSVEEVLSLEPLALFTPSSRENLLQVYREELNLASKTGSDSHRSRREEVEQYHKDGSIRWMEITVTLLRDQLGCVTGVLGVSRDVTDRKFLDQVKLDFITLVAHRLRQPLTSLRGYAELLLIRDDLSPQEQRLSLERINSQAIVLANTLNELSDISRLTAGHGLTLNRSWFRLDKTISRTVDWAMKQTSAHQFELVVPKLPAEFFGDETRVQEVLDGVLSNAIRYSPNGGRIRVECAVAGESWQISVEDKGIGMTDSQVQRLFDTFYRADTSNTAVDGSGLGMTAVKHLVEAMGGTIDVRSTYGQGTRVAIRLPMW